MNILITGIVRNCANTISQEYEILNKAFSGCKSIDWFLVESDSTDKSLECLESLRLKSPHFQFESLGSLGGKIPERTERLAYCRNKYISRLTNPEYQKIDYVVVADLDLANRLVTREIIEKSFLFDEHWDVLTANQIGPYYDVLALRHPLWCNQDCEATYKFLRKHQISHIDSLNAAVLSKMITIPSNAQPIPVSSAFGGLAIYKMEVLQGRRYIGYGPAGEPCCEHVSLNESITADGYKIFIHPALINNSLNEHSKRKLWHRQLIRKISNIWKTHC